MNRKVALILVLAVLIGIVAIILARSNSEDEISDILDLRARAIGSKDIKLLDKSLATNYKKPLEIMREHFNFWDAIEMRILDRSIVLESPDRAIVFQKYQFRVKSGDKWEVLEPAVEKLVLVREGRFFKKWKIAGGLLPEDQSTDKQN